MEGQSTSLKPSRKPAFVPGLGWGFKPRQSVEKGFGNRSVSKLTLGFQALFQFAAQTRSAQPNGLPLGWVACYCRRFSAAKRRRKREPESAGKFTFTTDFRLSFSYNCRNFYVDKTQVFEESSRGGFCLQKPSSRTFFLYRLNCCLRLK